MITNGFGPGEKTPLVINDDKFLLTLDELDVLVEHTIIEVMESQSVDGALDVLVAAERQGYTTITYHKILRPKDLVIAGKRIRRFRLLIDGNRYRHKVRRTAPWERVQGPIPPADAGNYVTAVVEADFSTWWSRLFR